MTVLAPPQAARVASAGRLDAGAGVVALATGASGLLAYAFQVLAARTLGTAAYGQVAALWGATFIAGIVLFRPLEQTAARALAVRLARGEEVRSAVRAVTTVAAVAAAAFLCLLVPLAPLLADRLFAGDRTVSALLGLAVVGYGAQYLLRGLAAGSRWFEGYGALLALDGVARLLVAVPLVVVPSRLVASTAIAVAGGAAAVVVALAAPGRLRSLLRPGVGAPFATRRALAFAAPAGVIAGADQLLVNGAPLLVLIEGGRGASAAAGVVFAATMLVRIPVFAVQGLAATLLPNAAELAERSELGAAVRRLLRRLPAAVAVAVIGIAVVAAVGPGLLHGVFGDGFHAGRASLVLLAVGVCCYVPALALSQGLLAVARGGTAARCWTAAAAWFVAAFFALPGDAVLRSSAALATATVLAAGSLLAAALRPQSLVPQSLAS